jgi:hypothetical protein
MSSFILNLSGDKMNLIFENNHSTVAFVAGTAESALADTQFWMSDPHIPECFPFY